MGVAITGMKFIRLSTENNVTLTQSEDMEEAGWEVGRWGVDQEEGDLPWEAAQEGAEGDLTRWENHHFEVIQTNLNPMFPPFRILVSGIGPAITIAQKCSKPGRWWRQEYNSYKDILHSIFIIHKISSVFNNMLPSVFFFPAPFWWPTCSKQKSCWHHTSITVDFKHSIILKLQTSLFESFDADIILNLNYLKITHPLVV